MNINTPKLYNADCREIMSKMESESIDIIVTDPQYWNHQTHDLFPIGDFIPEFFRILKPTGLAFIQCNLYTYPNLYTYLLKEFGWHYTRLLVWDKVLIENAKVFGRQFEMIAIGIMKDAKVYPITRGDIIVQRDLDESQRIARKERPVALYEKLLAEIEKGKTVFDPFMGTGTVGMACMKLGLNFIGSEIDIETFKLSQERVKS